jgi:type I restriction enzyme, S subunit
MEALVKTSEWVTRPLIEVATLQRGYDLPIQDRTDGLHPIFAANGTVGFHGSSKCKGPGVVTGRSGTIGKVHFVKTDFWPLNTSLYVKNFHGNDPKWVYYMLQSFGLASYSQGAGVPTLNRNLVHGEPVKVPPLPEQRRIAAILDQAETLRTQRRTALALLDTLTQSIFLAMFGDPVTNGSSWPLMRISDFVANFESGKSLVADDEDDSTSQYRVLKVSAVTSLEYKPEQSKAVPSDYNPPVSHIVRAGDLLFSRANTTELIGATALVNQTPDNLLLPDKLWRFVWHKTPRTEPLYVRHLFQQPKFRQEIGQRASGTSGSMKNITQDKVLSIQVGHPPIPLQQTFATRIAAIEALKSTHRTALAQLDALFASLQHRAFSGTL